MSDNATPPAGTSTETSQTPPPAPEPTSTVADDKAQMPAWLPERIKQVRQSERKAILEAFGVQNQDELKAKLDRLNELETATLSEKERAEKLLGELKPKAERLDKVAELFGQVVESQFAQLPEKIREAIDARASGDAEKRWDLMQVMSTAGLLNGQATPPAASATAPRPAQTAPAAPPPPSPTATQTPYDKWQALKSKDPNAASIFYQLNSSAIEQTRKA